MASWIVHLRIAENLLREISAWDRGYFAIGNIAPDSGLPDEAWEHFDPPPEVLHFKTQEDPRWPMADLDFYRGYLQEQSAPGLTPEDRAFRWGYFCHLVVDNLWRDEIALPTHDRFRIEFEADPKFIWTVKRDWYSLDFHYVRRHPDFLFWQEFQTTDYEIDGPDFLPPTNVQIRLDYIREYYQRTDDEVEHWLADMPGIYLTEPEMDDFVQHSTTRLGKIVNWLMSDERLPPHVVSALALSIV
jgi:hypothetical protein